MIRINYWKLVASIFICQLAGIIGSFFTISSVSTWYITLNKPIFNPPSWIFGPVWTVLYLSMGISLYLIWNKYSNKSKSNNSKLALTFFVIQLFLNALWSILFFGLKSPLLAFIEILFLWVAILLTLIYTFKISKLGSYILIPYLLWVSFAAVLNFFIFYLN